MPREGGWGSRVISKREGVFRVTTMSWNEIVVRVAQLGKHTKTTGMYALSGGSIWDGNYISIKWL